MFIKGGEFDRAVRSNMLIGAAAENKTAILCTTQSSLIDSRYYHARLRIGF